MMNDANSKQTRDAFRRRLLKAERHLTSVCGHMGTWIRQCGKCGLEVDWNRDLYEALVRAIAHQQLHGKAAACILNRLTEAYPGKSFPAPKEIVAADPTRLRSLGFSAAKVVAIQGIALAAIEKRIPSRLQAAEMSNEELVAQLIALRGVGRWTVEMLLIFSLGRLDVMPVDDYGVQVGLQTIYQLPSMPKKPEFAEMTDAWSPFRSVGAWYLWRVADDQKAKQSRAKQQ